MSVTVTITDKIKSGKRKWVFGTIALGAYATNGISLVSQILPSLESLAILGGKGGYEYDFDAANCKLKVFTPSVAHTHAFTGNAMSLTPTTRSGEPTTSLLENAAGTVKATDVTAIPLGTPAGSNASSTAAVGTEVTNQTSLSAITALQFLAIGR